jgi:hypothetical protein
MGRQAQDDYISWAETGKELGVSPPTLRHLVREGILLPHHFKGSNRSGVFLLSEVQAVHQALGEEKNPDLRQVKGLALQALSAARRTETRLTDIAEQLGLDLPTIPRDDEFVRSLHEMSKMHFSPAMVTDSEWLKFWSDMFFSMDETYLELTALVAQDNEPWKCFIDFSSNVLRALHELREDVPLRAQRRFKAARDHLLHIGWSYCGSLHSTRIANVVFNGKAAAIDELEAILS